MQINDNVWMQVIRGTWLIALADVVALGFFFKGLEQPWGLCNFLAMTVLQLAVGVVCLTDGSVSNLAIGALYLALGVPYLLRIAVFRGDEWALPVLVIAVSIFIPIATCARRTDSRARLAAFLRPIVTLYALICVGILTWSAVNDAVRHPRYPNRWLLGLLVAFITVEWIFTPKRGRANR